MGSFHVMIAALSVALAYGGAFGADRLLDRVGSALDAQVQIDGSADAVASDDEKKA